MESQYHYPLKWFKKHNDRSEACLLLLNSPLGELKSLITYHWSRFAETACADGGSNRLYDLIQEDDRKKYIPNVICGDFDSAKQEVLKFYESEGCTLVHYGEQDSTDFTKTIVHLLKLRADGKLQFSSVYAMNALWGRFDQTLANINTLYMCMNWTEHHPLDVYLVSEESILFCLQPGYHIIDVSSRLEEGHCGLVPLTGPCESCTTTGLKWNLKQEFMKVGGLVSTNNLIDDGVNQVTVENTHALLWTMSHLLTRSD